MPAADPSGVPLPNRRTVMAGTAATFAFGVSALPVCAAYTDDGDDTAAIRNIANGRKIMADRVTLTLPELAENGNVVSLTVDVASPMTPTDYVKTIHIIASKNPLANIVRLNLGPRSGRARVQTTIRLATTQTVTALAEMGDGTLWSGTSTVLVTLSACLDGG